MTGLRLVLVTQRFWPLVGDTETAMASLAGEMCRRGHRPIVLTARWSRSWPERIVCREVPVVRLPYHPASPWSGYRYTGAVARWLRKNRNEVDAVYATGTRYDAGASIDAMADTPVPVALRVDPIDLGSNPARRQPPRFDRGYIRRCKQADAVLVADASTRAQLLAADCSDRAIHLIPNGVAVPAAPSRPEKLAAREAMSLSNPMFALPAHSPLVVGVGPFGWAGRWDNTCLAFRAIVGRWPNARLLIVGDGPDRQQLVKRIEKLGLAGRVQTAGVLDDAEVVLTAADLLVYTGTHAGTSFPVLEAMARCVPIVAVDTPGNREALSDPPVATLVAPEEQEPLSRAMTCVLNDRNAANRAAQAARRLAVERFSLEAMATRHVELFERLWRGDA